MSNIHQFIHNANVKVKAVKDEKGHQCALINVNGQYEHEFNHKSRVSRHLDIMTPEDLQTRLTGGSYFFIENQLVDWRDGSYSGFKHSDATVDQYMDLFGYVNKKDVPFIHRTKDNAHPIALRKVWDSANITVPGYSEGGKFTSELSFVWNPFVSFINSSFDLVRLICTNGMVGVTSFLNSKVPLVNRQVEHLDIACRQIQNKVNSIVVDRIQIMSNERASVGQCLLLEQHIVDRLITVDSSVERNNLLRLLNVVSPSTQLSHVYRESVFDNKDLCAQIPSHITMFDAFNVATEVRTHTSESKNSSDFALDKFSNSMLFNDEQGTVIRHNNNTPVSLASFSNPENAFMGILEAA